MNIIRGVGFAGVIFGTALAGPVAESPFQDEVLETLQRVPDSALTNGNNFYVLSKDQPPLPFFPPLLKDLDLPVYQVVEGGITKIIIDDRLVDYQAIHELHTALLQAEGSLGLLSAEDGPPLPPGAGGGSGGQTNPPAAARVYGTNAMWLEITASTNAGFADLTLHNTHSNQFYQLHCTLNLTNLDWIPGEIVTNTAQYRGFDERNVHAGADDQFRDVFSGGGFRHLGFHRQT